MKKELRYYGKDKKGRDLFVAVDPKVAGSGLLSIVVFLGICIYSFWKVALIGLLLIGLQIVFGVIAYRIWMKNDKRKMKLSILLISGYVISNLIIYLTKHEFVNPFSYLIGIGSIVPIIILIGYLYNYFIKNRQSKPQN